MDGRFIKGGGEVNTRYFAHTSGFRDNTIYMKERNGVAVPVSKNGATGNNGWRLRDCLDMVKLGLWKEITKTEAREALKEA